MAACCSHAIATDPVAIIVTDRDREILPSNAVINTGHLDLVCLGISGNRDLLWEATNISNLNNGEITPEGAANFPGFDVSYLISDRSFIRLNSELATPLITGYISCRSRQSNISVEAFVTRVDPLWRVISPAMDVVPVGAEVNITLQYGDNSVGSGNLGSGFVYTLRFLPCVRMLPDETLLAGMTDELSNTVEYSFRAGLLDSGEYQWNCMYVMFCLKS